MFRNCWKRTNYYLDLADDLDAYDEVGSYCYALQPKESSKFRFTSIIEQLGSDYLASALSRRFRKIDAILTQCEKNNPHKTKTSQYVTYKQNFVDKANKLLPFINGTNTNKEQLTDALNAFETASQNFPLSRERIGKLVAGVVIGTILCWAVGIALPTLIGMKLLSSGLVFNNFFQAANAMCMIPQGQAAIGICTTVGAYGVSKMFDWMRIDNTAAQKIKPEVDKIKKLLLSSPKNFADVYNEETLRPTARARYLNRSTCP